MGNPDNSALLQENSDTLIVVPVFAESSVIADVVTELAQYFPNICCIDDGSPDSSGVIALQAGAQVIWHPMNLGQGAALQTGIEAGIENPEIKKAEDLKQEEQAGEEGAIMDNRKLNEMIKNAMTQKKD